MTKATDNKLKKAIEGHRYPEILELVKQGANPNIKSANGYALPHACWYLEVELVRELLARGANPDINDGEALERTVSTTNGDGRAVLQLLLDHGVKLDFPCARFENSTPVGVAIETGHPHLAEMLVEAGADLKVKNDDKKTPVQLAKFWGFTKLHARMTGKKSNAIDPWIETTYAGQVGRGKAPHTSGEPWKTVFEGKHFPGCQNPPVHLLALDLSLIPEFPAAIRKLGRMNIVSHSCECDERDYYAFSIGKDRKLSDLDHDWTDCNECEPGDYRPSKKPTPIRIVRESKETRSNCGIWVGGLPSWAQQPIWPSCPKCDEAGFFVARLSQYELPPSAPGRGNHINVFACGTCRTQCLIRQST